MAGRRSGRSGREQQRLHPTAADVGKTLDVLASFTDPVTHSVEHVTALGGTVDALPGLAITGTSATGSVPSSALTPTAASYLTADHDLINTPASPPGSGRQFCSETTTVRHLRSISRQFSDPRD